VWQVLLSVDDKNPQISLLRGVVLSQSTFHLVTIVNLHFAVDFDGMRRDSEMQLLSAVFLCLRVCLTLKLVSPWHIMWIYSAVSVSSELILHVFFTSMYFVVFYQQSVAINCCFYLNGNIWKTLRICWGKDYCPAVCLKFLWGRIIVLLFLIQSCMHASSWFCRVLTDAWQWMYWQRTKSLHRTWT